MEETVSSKLIYSGKVVRLRVDTVQGAGGRRTTREIVEHDDCVAIVPLDENGKVLLVKQYRKPIEKELLEIPAGGIDPGEDAESAVRRELREETGYFPRKVKRLGGFYASPGYSSEYLHLYLATDLTRSPLRAEDTDEIKLVRVPVSELRQLVTSGAICDDKSIAGICLFLEYYRDYRSRHNA